jgi:predicted HicB family RNase H-like nuclease
MGKKRSLGALPKRRVSLDTCRALSREPQKAHSGKLSLRLEPSLHVTVAANAELAHKSIKQWVCDALSLATRQPAG